MQHAFDLELIDLDLPGGSGVDVVGALHHHQPQALPVVVTFTTTTRICSRPCKQEPLAVC